MNLVKFEHTHMDMAKRIALSAYELERSEVPSLPEVKAVPDLSHFADNQLGVAAFDEDVMVGFLCAYSPIKDAFGTTNTKGTFSPIHAHGINPSYRSRKDRIYSMLYQEAAKGWIKEGILSHGIALYAHDREAINSFFFNGFGLRCIDAVRSLNNELVLKEVILPRGEDIIEFSEIPKEEWKLLLEGHNALIEHLGNSPTFMKFSRLDEEELYRRAAGDTRYFGARIKGSYVAYIKVCGEGENFATEVPGMINICGAYCNPMYRGSGLYHYLLCYLSQVLRKEGYLYLGVDFESFNPNARGFWLKHFTEYTYSVVRRIDDKAIQG